MASELKVDKFTGVTTAGSIDVTGEGNSTTTNLQQGLLKAWSHITTHNTVADSLNLSSVTDQGTGQSNDNFTNAFGNTTYCITYGSRDGGGTNDDRIVVSGSSEQFTTSDGTLASDQATYVAFGILGDLA